MLTFPNFTPLFPRHEWVLPHILERQATQRADFPFLQWTDAQPARSFSEVNRLVNRLAHGFAAKGVKKGDRVIVFLPNSLEYVLIWFALSKLGAVEVTVGPAHRGAFLRHQLEVGSAEIIVATHGLTERIAEIESELTTLRHVILVNDPDEAGGDIARFSRLTVSDFEALYCADESNPGVAISPRDAAAVLFTSGTTGPSKGVLIPHSQLYWFAEEISQLAQLTPDDVYMTGFPLFHANAQAQTVYPALRTGMRCVLYSKFSASDWLGRIRRSGTTVTNSLGATTSFILAQPPSSRDRDHHLRCIFAAPSPGRLAQKLKDRFGVSDVVTAYGQTEITNVFLSPPGMAPPEGACGVALGQWFEYRLIDPDTDEDAPAGAPGELWIRHKVPGIISDSFFGMPEKTIESRRDLWFHTGDAMRRDDEGWYYFVDRMKDTLRRRGENISSFEVEEVVRLHPAVTECAVVAAPADQEGGEDEVKVCVVLADGRTLPPAELIAFCETRMPQFAVPRYVEYLESLPKTPSEKIQKGELRARGVTSTTWDRQAGVKQGRSA